VVWQLDFKTLLARLDLYTTSGCLRYLSLGGQAWVAHIYSNGLLLYSNSIYYSMDYGTNDSVSSTSHNHIDNPCLNMTLHLMRESHLMSQEEVKSTIKVTFGFMLYTY
jgi:hypothetical protein